MTTHSEEDELLADIAASIAAPVTTPHKMGGVTRPSILGAAKRGRRPKLTREQVDHILLSSELVDALAERFGVSTSTIIRARNHEYVTADEPGYHNYFHEKRGRRTLSGVALDEETREKIATDPSPADIVAATYGVTRSYVYNLRTRYGTATGGRRSPLPREVMVEIIKSELPDEQLAHLLDLSPAVVKAIREANRGKADT